MSSDRIPPRRSLRRTLLSLALAVLLAPIVGCGRKENPEPPPRKNPAKTTDLQVRQRGQTLFVTMSYPAATMGGLALPGIDRVEYKRYSRPAPEFMQRSADEGAESEAEPVAETEAEVQVEEMEEESRYQPVPSAEEGATSEEGETSEESAAMQPAGTVEPNPFLQIRVDTEEFEKRAEEVLVLEGTALESAVAGGQIVARFPLDEVPTDPPVAYSFQVRTFTGRLRSPDSNIASFVPLPPPPPPIGASLEASASGVRLAWEMPPGVVPKPTVTAEAAEAGGTSPATPTSGEGAEPEADTAEAAQADAEPAPAAEEGSAEDGMERAETGEGEGTEVATEIGPASETAEAGAIEIVGYSIYRRPAQSSLFPPIPIASVEPTESEFTDRSAQYGRSYVYAITTVRMWRPAVESELGEELAIVYRDEFAPQPPRGLVLLAEAGRTRLVWEANAESDVVGYLVLVRREEGDYERLTPDPISANEYVHRSTISGATYSYRVIAVDTAGNQSEPSREATTRAP